MPPKMPARVVGSLSEFDYLPPGAVMNVLDPFWFPKVWGKPKRYVARMLARIRQARQNPWSSEKNKNFAEANSPADPPPEKNKNLADSSGTLELRKNYTYTVRPTSP